MLARQPPEIGAEQGLQEWAPHRGSGGGVAEEQRAGLRKAFALELGGRVHADHLVPVDAALQLFQCRERNGKAARHVGAVQQHRVIARKELPLVLEHAQLVALDLRVGGVDIHDVDAPRRHRLIGEAVIEAGRRRLRQAIGALQAGPAVGATDELLR